MKKLISLLLILCMACMLIPAMAEDSAVGTWYLGELVEGGATINPAQVGMVWTITLNEDGTASSAMEIMGEKEEQGGTWSQDGANVTITIDGSDAVFTLADGTLTIDQGEAGKAVFTQEAPEAVAAAGAVAAESEDVFLGNWDLTAVSTLGMTVTKDLFESANMGGFNITLTVEAGKAVLTIKTSADAAEQNIETTTVFEDGKLLLTVADTQIASIELLEDGSISYQLAIGSLSMTVFMVRAD